MNDSDDYSRTWGLWMLGLIIASWCVLYAIVRALGWLAQVLT